MSESGTGGYTDGIDGVEDMDAVDMLTGDDQDEPYDTSYSPPDYEPSAARHGMTAREEREGETLDQRLAEEEPDIGPDDAADETSDPRAGRLVAPDEGEARTPTHRRSRTTPARPAARPALRRPPYTSSPNPTNSAAEDGSRTRLAGPKIGCVRR